MEIAFVYNYTRKMYEIVCRTGLFRARDRPNGLERREIANKPRRGLMYDDFKRRKWAGILSGICRQTPSSEGLGGKFFRGEWKGLVVGRIIFELLLGGLEYAGYSVSPTVGRVMDQIKLFF